jgi:hypothetical protein
MKYLSRSSPPFIRSSLLVPLANCCCHSTFKLAVFFSEVTHTCIRWLYQSYLCINDPSYKGWLQCPWHKWVLDWCSKNCPSQNVRCNSINELTSWRRFPKLLVSKLVKKFIARNRIQSHMTVFSRTLPLVPFLSQMNPARF